MIALLCGIIGLIAGAFIPALASRFGKVLPGDPGWVITQLYHRPRITKSKNPKRQEQLRLLWRKFFIISLLWAIAECAMFVGVAFIMTGASLVYACLFLYMVSVLMSIDRMFFLLPDFFTIPLLVLGMTAAAFESSFVSMQDAVLGAWFGYAISVVAVLVMSRFSDAEFGAGDAKMLTALGAWFGAMELNYAVVASFVLFTIEAIMNKCRIGAYGPALGVASIAVFFYMALR